MAETLATIGGRHVQTIKQTETMRDLKTHTSKDLRAELQTRGFFTENLWHVHDVMDRFMCNELEAIEVLRAALTDQFTIENISEIVKQLALDSDLEEFEEAINANPTFTMQKRKS
tara:strand:+ start:162 stop:506 length:345 start_codon:yes stop_codon:yes gene_type:complete